MLSNEETDMKTNFIRMGDYFINPDRILWARISHDATHPHRRTLTLLSGAGEDSAQLTFEGEDAEELITFFEKQGHDLNPPAFKPSP